MRIQLQFNDEATNRIKKLKETTEATSYVDVIKNALQIYEHLVEYVGAGAQVGVIHPDRTIKLVRLFKQAEPT